MPASARAICRVSLTVCWAVAWTSCSSGRRGLRPARSCATWRYSAARARRMVPFSRSTTARMSHMPVAPTCCTSDRTTCRPAWRGRFSVRSRSSGCRRTGRRRPGRRVPTRRRITSARARSGRPRRSRAGLPLASHWCGMRRLWKRRGPGSRSAASTRPASARCWKRARRGSWWCGHSPRPPTPAALPPGCESA